MWITLVDIKTEYVVNLNKYQCFRKSEDCEYKPTIVFYSETGNDLILSFEYEAQRDVTYSMIISKLGA